MTADETSLDGKALTAAVESGDLAAIEVFARCFCHEGFFFDSSGFGICSMPQTLGRSPHGRSYSQALLETGRYMLMRIQEGWEGC